MMVTLIALISLRETCSRSLLWARRTLVLLCSSCGAYYILPPKPSLLMNAQIAREKGHLGVDPCVETAKMGAVYGLLLMTLTVLRKSLQRTFSQTLMAEYEIEICVEYPSRGL
jgi:hypothetical protein